MIYPRVPILLCLSGMWDGRNQFQFIHINNLFLRTTEDSHEKICIRKKGWIPKEYFPAFNLQFDLFGLILI